MVGLDLIRKSNAALKTGPAGVVGLFVGATSGIGEATLRSFYTHSNKPHAYFVGRNMDAANRIIDELKKLNPEGTIEFLQGDMTLMKNVDSVVEKFKSKEDKLNLLVFSQGYLTMAGREESVEGIDKKLACNYYSRARFVQGLLPQLEAAAAANPDVGARVLSVLGAGREGEVNYDDLDLKKTFSLRNAERHAVTFTTAIYQHLAATHPTVGFIHAMPGAVNTNILGNPNMSAPIRIASTVLSPILKLALIDPKESGERFCFVGTSDQYKKGAFCINQKTEEIESSKKAVEAGHCDKAAGEKIWKHTEDLFNGIPQAEGSK